jgi:hypothetical protein
MQMSIITTIFKKSFLLLVPKLGTYVSLTVRRWLGRSSSPSSASAALSAAVVEPVTPASLDPWPKLMLGCEGDYGLSSIDDIRLYWVDESYLTIAGPISLSSVLDDEKLRLSRPARVL